MNNKFKRSGFTLIELLVVMVIMAVLVFIAASSFISTQKKSRDSARKSDLKQIANALELYYQDHGEFPQSISDQIFGCGSQGEEPCEPGSEFSAPNNSGSLTVYMVQLPDDPTSGTYIYKSNGSAYQLYARLENYRDANVRNPEDVDPDGDDQADIYTTGCQPVLGCNYGVSSSNISLDAPIDAGGTGLDVGI